MSALAFTLAATASLFVVVDPIGTLPFFVALTHDFDEHDRQTMVERAVSVLGGVLVAFAIFGRYLFAAFGFTLFSIEIAGGILLFFTAYDMFRGEMGQKLPPATREEAIQRRDELAVAPLGIPLLAGPGSIATVMVYVGNSGSDVLSLLGIFVAIAIVTVSAWLILRYGQGLFRHLGRVGITAITRILGLLLAALAVQFIVNGVLGIVQGLPH